MIFFHKESKSQKKFGGGEGAGWGCGGGEGDRWMDSRKGPDQFAPLTFSKLGA